MSGEVWYMVGAGRSGYEWGGMVGWGGMGTSGEVW